VGVTTLLLEIVNYLGKFDADLENIFQAAGSNAVV
jgi:hypothetical protein